MLAAMMGELGKSRVRPTKLKFSTCVDSIRDNFRRISGRVKRGDSPAKVPEERIQVVDELSNEENRTKKQNHRRRKNSFELYLSTIPKMDPVDRTVGWVLMQPDNHVSNCMCVKCIINC